MELTVFDPDYDPDGTYAAELVATVVAGLAPLGASATVTAPASPQAASAAAAPASPAAAPASPAVAPASPEPDTRGPRRRAKGTPRPDSSAIASA